jgi:hypothetical protein
MVCHVENKILPHHGQADETYIALFRHGKNLPGSNINLTIKRNLQGKRKKPNLNSGKILRFCCVLNLNTLQTDKLWQVRYIYDK